MGCVFTSDSGAFSTILCLFSLLLLLVLMYSSMDLPLLLFLLTRKKSDFIIEIRDDCPTSLQGVGSSLTWYTHYLTHPTYTFTLIRNHTGACNNTYKRREHILCVCLTVQDNWAFPRQIYFISWSMLTLQSVVLFYGSRVHPSASLSSCIVLPQSFQTRF